LLPPLSLIRPCTPHCPCFFPTTLFSLPFGVFVDPFTPYFFGDLFAPFSFSVFYYMCTLDANFSGRFFFERRDVPVTPWSSKPLVSVLTQHVDRICVFLSCRTPLLTFTLLTPLCLTPDGFFFRLFPRRGPFTCLEFFFRPPSPF